MRTSLALLTGGMLSLAVASCIALAAVPHADDTTLPPCPTEDSDNCYWDADTMGNGQGTDSVVVIPTESPEIVPATPAEPVVPLPVELPATDSDPVVDEVPVKDGARQDYDLGVLECGVNAAPAVDQDEYGNWWAYCEPALVNDDGTLWGE